MSRLLVIEPSKEAIVVQHSTPGATERNRLVSWKTAAQRPNEYSVETLRSKISLSINPIGLANKYIKLIGAIPTKLVYTVFKLGFEIAKILIGRLSKIRRLLFVPKQVRKNL
jgi:hypothetical protein